MKLTFGSEIVCPNCKKEIAIKTEGLLGGILKQLFLIKLFEVIKRGKTDLIKKITIVCGSCGHEFTYDSKSHQNP